MAELSQSSRQHPMLKWVAARSASRAHAHPHMRPHVQPPAHPHMRPHVHPPAHLAHPAHALPPLTTCTRRGKVSYMHIYEDGDLTLGVFLLPAGACIPLHNHPGMTVVSRLLFGSLHIKAYDLLSEAPKAEDSQEELQRGRSLLHSSSSSSNSSANSRQWGHKVGQRHKAQLRMDRVVTAPEQDVMVLYPTSRLGPRGGCAASGVRAARVEGVRAAAAAIPLAHTLP